MKKILFIDRDGTLIKEPPVDYQVDSLEKLEFYPKVFQGMQLLVEMTDFQLVMVTNQDGLGTDSFPEEDFLPAHNKMMDTFKGEGVEFDAVHIDKSFPEDNAPTRKPRTGMLVEYISDGYDLANSYVIGDRLSDVELAKNLGTQAILFLPTDSPVEIPDELLAAIALKSNDWIEVARFLAFPSRKITHTRKTKETDITITLDLDGKGGADIKTGLNFFDHMLDQIARHSGVDLTIHADGDLEIDEHHTMEDTALALGEAFDKALGNKRGIERYGFCLPMDDALAQVAIDFGGRNWCEWEVTFKREKIGDVPTEMFYHFFKSFSDAARCNLNIQADGENEHHKIEAVFKAFAKSIKMAVRQDKDNMILPSTKGTL